VIETAGRAQIDPAAVRDEERTDLLASWAFTGMHLGALMVLFTGLSWPAAVVALLTLWVRLLGITGGYHRLFSHRSYKTSRTFQFALAWLGASAGQNGPLWWASHHRLHHRHADTEDDVHSPGIGGFWWAHAGWILCRKYKGYDASVVRDLGRYPELRFLEKNHMLAPLGLALGLFLTGWWLEVRWPGLGTTRWQLLGWGFFVSTVVLYHITFLVNSVAHTIGRHRFATSDHSRNNWWVALLTAGEGWHNNHHRWPTSERQGFYWWELDLTHYALRALQKLGLVWDLRGPPERLYREAESAQTG
jgi:stearoyl-CoA desaturase (delta-9 desaturase)